MHRGISVGSRLDCPLAGPLREKDRHHASKARAEALNSCKRGEDDLSDSERSG